MILTMKDVQPVLDELKRVMANQRTRQDEDNALLVQQQAERIRVLEAFVRATDNYRLIMYTHPDDQIAHNTLAYDVDDARAAVGEVGGGQR